MVVWLEKYLLLDKRNWPLKKKKPLSLRIINQRKYVLSTALLRSYESVFCCCGRQEEPTILMSRLLLRTHRMYVVSFRFELPLRMNGMHRTHFDHVRLDLQSLVILSRVF